MYTADDIYKELKDLKNISLIIFNNNKALFYIGVKNGTRLVNDYNVKGRAHLNGSVNSTFCISDANDFLKYLKGVKEPIIYDKNQLIITTPSNDFEFIVDPLPPEDQWPNIPNINNPDILYKGLDLKTTISYRLLRFEENGAFIVSGMGHKKRVNTNSHDVYTQIDYQTISRLPKLKYDYINTSEYLYLRYVEPLTNEVKYEFYLTNDIMVTDDIDFMI